jgi:hypothetical protein
MSAAPKKRKFQWLQLSAAESDYTIISDLKTGRNYGTQ